MYLYFSSNTITLIIFLQKLEIFIINFNLLDKNIFFYFFKFCINYLLYIIMDNIITISKKIIGVTGLFSSIIVFPGFVVAGIMSTDSGNTNYILPLIATPIVVGFVSIYLII